MAAWLESAWLARYLDRQLSAEESAWFEAYALEKPDLLAVIETDNALRDALAVHDAANDGPMAGSAGADRPTRVAPRSRAHPRRGVPRWAGLAACLVAGLALGWIGPRSLPSAPGTGALIANPPRIVFDTMRGVPEAPNVERGDADAPYTLIEVALPPGAEHVALRIGAQAPVPLSPSPDGFVSFLIARTAIDPKAAAEIRYMLDGADQVRPISLEQLDAGQPEGERR
jgi:hypothetical protein